MSTLPGLILATALAVLGIYGSDLLGQRLFDTTNNPLSAVMVAIVLGLIVRNLFGLSSVFQLGVTFSLSWVLRAGIVLLGLKLGLSELGQVGLQALPIVIACIAIALTLVTLLGKFLNVPGRLTTLIAVGTSICGATAIVATSPVIGAKQNETSYAVACIAIFGLAAMLLYPVLSHTLFDGESIAAGIFLGTAVHDTAQVVGAAMSYEQIHGSSTTLETATVTKMLRNLSMLIVIPLMSVLYHRGAASGGASPSLRSMVPLFVVGFALMSLLRTIGDLGGQPFGILQQSQWTSLLAYATTASAFCLTIAMAAVGLSTNLKDIFRIGIKPMLMGLIAALLVGVASTLLVHWLIL